VKSTLLTLLGFIAIVTAQQLPYSQVFLQNAEAEAVSLGLSCDGRQTWKTVILDGHETQSLKCDSRTAKMWAHIDTDLEGESHKEAELELRESSRYDVYFDQASRKWNLRVVSSGGATAKRSA
jgi:hypothetical protein